MDPVGSASITTSSSVGEKLTDRLWKDQAQHVPDPLHGQ